MWGELWFKISGNKITIVGKNKFNQLKTFPTFILIVATQAGKNDPETRNFNVCVKQKYWTELYPLLKICYSAFPYS